MSEIIFLALLALIVIGPKELPELARTLGRFLNELKRSTNVLSDELKTQTRFDGFNLEDTLLNSRKPPVQPPAPAANPQETKADEQQLELPLQKEASTSAADEKNKSE